jgi:hypothetical protein
MNIAPETGKAALRLGLFIVVMAAGMLPFLAPSSAQFAITVFTLIIGIVFCGLVVIVVQRFSR